MRLTSLRSRFPAWGEIVSVFAFISLLVYGRMLYVFVWKTPSWLYYLTTGEIFSILSYSLVVSFFESAGYTALLAMIGFLLPERWFRREFITRSAWGMTGWLAVLVLYFHGLSNPGFGGGMFRPNTMAPWALVALIAGILFAIFSPLVRPMKTSAMWIADQAIIFLYIFLPTSLIGAVVATLRNLS
jgi:hypothetical protein